MVSMWILAHRRPKKQLSTRLLVLRRVAKCQAMQLFLLLLLLLLLMFSTGRVQQTALQYCSCIKTELLHRWEDEKKKKKKNIYRSLTYKNSQRYFSKINQALNSAKKKKTEKSFSKNTTKKSFQLSRL